MGLKYGGKRIWAIRIGTVIVAATKEVNTMNRNEKQLMTHKISEGITLYILVNKCELVDDKGFYASFDGSPTSLYANIFLLCPAIKIL